MVSLAGERGGLLVAKGAAPRIRYTGVRRVLRSTVSGRTSSAAAAPRSAKHCPSPPFA